MRAIFLLSYITFCAQHARRRRAKRRVISVPPEVACRAARRSELSRLPAAESSIPRRLLTYKPSPRGEGGPLAVDEVQYLHLVYGHLEMPLFRFSFFV